MSKTAESIEKAGKGEYLPPQFVIDMILEIARNLRGKNLSDIAAITIAQAVINDFTSHYAGLTFYFHVRSTKEGCEEKRFFITTIAKHVHLSGVAPAEAEQIAGKVVEKLFFSHEGINYYVPKFDKKGRAVRDAAIIAEYGKDPSVRTANRLAGEYGLTFVRVYQIVKGETGSSKRKSARDVAIIAEYGRKPTHNTLKRLAAEHKLSESRVYVIATEKKY